MQLTPGYQGLCHTGESQFGRGITWVSIMEAGSVSGPSGFPLLAQLWTWEAPLLPGVLFCLGVPYVPQCLQRCYCPGCMGAWDCTLHFGSSNKTLPFSWSRRKFEFCNLFWFLHASLVWQKKPVLCWLSISLSVNE